MLPAPIPSVSAEALFDSANHLLAAKTSNSLPSFTGQDESTGDVQVQ